MTGRRSGVGHRRGPIGALGSADHAGRRGAGQTAHRPRVQGAGSRRPRRWSAIRWRSSTASVELDDVRVVVDGWTGSVNHNWGRRHTPAYAFGQVCGFDDAPESSLEIVTAHAAVGPVVAACRHAVRPAPRRRGVGGALGPRRPATPAASIGRSLVVRGPRRRIDDGGRDHRRSRATSSGSTYTDTDGETKYCYNSALATCRIRLSARDFGEAELNATRRAMFEILTDARHEAVRLLA